MHHLTTPASHWASQKLLETQYVTHVIHIFTCTRIHLEGSVQSQEFGMLLHFVKTILSTFSSYNHLGRREGAVQTRLRGSSYNHLGRGEGAVQTLVLFRGCSCSHGTGILESTRSVIQNSLKALELLLTATSLLSHMVSVVLLISRRGDHW